MTGFAHGKYEFNDFSLSISFKSLNHRFIDISFKGTGITPASEKLIKEIIKDRVYRGKIEITFDLIEYDPKKWNVQLNESLMGNALDKVLLFKKKYEDRINLSMDPFLRIPMLFHINYTFNRLKQKDIQNIKNSVKSVFDEFLKSRESEGKSILDNLLSSIDVIKMNTEIIEKKAGQIEKDIFFKYKEKMKKLLDNDEIDERRISLEAAITAEKLCVAEEINRLKTHNKRLRDLLKDKKVNTKGREADFLSQEMQRETRTIASKTNSLEVHDHILQIRREIEEIRQQVQNVE